MEEFTKLALLTAIGVIAGFLNVTAGGGTLLALPVLIFMGLPAPIANGTNRIAILLQNIIAVGRFHKFKAIPKGVTLLTCVPAIFGAIIGAQIAVDIDELLFKRILAIIMVGVIVLTFFRKKGDGHEVPEINAKKKVGLALAFFFIGVYGGFIQAGIGFLIITVLTLVGYDLVRTNALKVFVVLFFTPLALLIFIWNNQVHFVFGIALATGNAIGAWLASRFVVEKGHGVIRWIVLVAVVVFAVKLFFE